MLKMVREKQPFHQQKGGQRRKTLKELKNAVEKISSGDPVGLLLSYFETNLGKDHFQLLQKKFSEPRLESLLKNISKAHQNAGTKEKRQILSLLSSIFTFNQLHDCGFKINYSNLNSANKHLLENGPGFPVPKPTPPTKKRKISEDIQQKIQDFFLSDEISRVAPNRTILKKFNGVKIITPVQYLECSISEVYKRFKDQNQEITCSESTFRRYMPKEMKKARRETDMCPICQAGKRKKSMLERDIDRIHIHCDNSCTKDHRCTAEISMV